MKTNIFAAPEFGWLIDRLAARIKSGRSIETGTITIKDASTAQRRSIDDLLGRRSTGGRNLTIDLARLGIPEAMVISLRGPLVNLRAEREANAESWNTFFTQWRQRMTGHDAALRWLEGLGSSGLLKRYPNAEELIGHAWSIIEGIPHDDILLASLAAKVTGDSHALDRGRALGSLCLRAISEIEGIDGNASAATRREAWAAIGVTIDDLSAPVLCLNLPAAEGSHLAPWIDWHVARGEPFYLTWRHLQKFTPAPETPAVYVCENPAIVSEAARRPGARCKPLICLNGLPSAGVKMLLRKLSRAGIELHLRADFDWAGLSFIHQLISLEGARPWRMSAVDYQRCNPTQALKGDPFCPKWAKDLSDAMLQTGLAAYEEEIADLLLNDLEN